MHRLSHHFSPSLLTLVDPTTSRNPDIEIITSTTTYHTFPRPERFLSVHSATHKCKERFVGVQADLENVLRELGFGYRAGFIMNTLKCLIDENGGEVAVRVERGETDDEAVKRVGEAIERFLISLREDETIVTNVENKKAKKSTSKGKGREKENVRQKGEDRWRRELLKFKGVGRKVADCIGLMSLDRVSDGYRV
jgi:3-methyladenine DNA glycosylase/8-oxoguanine DNA glycosylase